MLTLIRRVQGRRPCRVPTCPSPGQSLPPAVPRSPACAGSHQYLPLPPVAAGPDRYARSPPAAAACSPGCAGAGPARIRSGPAGPDRAGRRRNRRH
ncbi:hypothetical protein G6F35_018784 [Rhizopus arrhizus]|nr:hypothetical protein G6F35_018784 [Rhizopus arrhizus]